MAAKGVGIFAAGFIRSRPRLSFISSSTKTHEKSRSANITPEKQHQGSGTPSFSDKGRISFQKNNSVAANHHQRTKEKLNTRGGSDDDSHVLRLRRDYLEQSREIMRSSSDDAGPPRWFSPLDCSCRFKDTPLLLYLPGIDGVGLGLALQHKKLGEIFDIWCLHIPIMDRTPFADLVMFVEETVGSENRRMPERPIYLVGECFGGCLALAVAARNQDIDILLILANPATCFHKSQMQSLLILSQLMPHQLQAAALPFMLTGIPSSLVKSMAEKELPLQPSIEELYRTALALPYYLSDLANISSTETLLWKLKMLKSAAEYANSRLHAVKAQTLILSSGKDQLLPSQEEGERLYRTLSRCEIRRFTERSHDLFLEEGFDLVTVIKGVSFYRRGRYTDYVSDYLPPTPVEFNRVRDLYRFWEVAVNPVMLSTLENGQIVQGLSGVPWGGPVLFVGYHMMLGLELVPLVSRLWMDRKILARGLAHPLLFTRGRSGKLPDLSPFDIFRIMGAVPVSASNLYKLFSSKSHILLYPGGMREALHKKGEEYKLFWPRHGEFVRMAATFGAKIIPFGVVGEDDIGQLLLDYDDLMKIPYFRAHIEELTQEAGKLRNDSEGEVANQYAHLPIIAPKIPGRFYYLFGKPIETQGRKEELRSREKAHQLYTQVKSEVENCISFLKEKRESDPYRNLLPRFFYQAIHGFHSHVPTFDLQRKRSL